MRPGDTVASVANGYDALVKDVVSANKLVDPFIIVVGQKLAVPGGYRPLPKKVVLAAIPSRRRRATTTSKQRVSRSRGDSLPVLGNTPQEQFIGSIAEAAVESADNTGVPASVTIAQAILESYWGSSRLAREANNYFGIKAQTRAARRASVWFDVWEVIGGRNVMQSRRSAPTTRSPSRSSTMADSSWKTGGTRGRWPCRTIRDQFAREINRAGYATDPAYASKLIGLMDRYNLYRFDACSRVTIRRRYG